ncbi:MAG: DUF192 domain-containing protein [Bdellovibrionales bacterium]
MTLKRVNESTILFPELSRAQTPWARAIGLLRHKGLSSKEALWITKCWAIHTFFMRFAIDCVFVNRKGTVVKVYHDLKPWRLAGPVWGATDVIEMAAGQAREKNIRVGDIVECGP